MTSLGKKLISLVLIAAILVTTFPTLAFAEESEINVLDSIETGSTQN